MVYEIRGSACEGYTVRFRYVTQSDTRDASQITDQQTTTFEDADGKSFSFVTKSYTDQNLDKELRGNATREPQGVKIQIDKPETKSFDLQPTQFPTQHLVDLINRAKTGETFYETSIFDGSEDADKAMTTTVVVGKPTNASSSDPELKALNALGTEQFWPVDIAYFDETSEGGEDTPEYRISFKLYENGLTRDLADGLWRLRHPRAACRPRRVRAGRQVDLQPIGSAPRGGLCRRPPVALGRAQMVSHAGRQRRGTSPLRRHDRCPPPALPGAAKDLGAPLRHHRPRTCPGAETRRRRV